MRTCPMRSFHASPASAVVPFVCSALFLLACSSSTESGDAGTSDGGTSDASTSDTGSQATVDGSSTADAKADSPASPFASCTEAQLDADDHLATGADVSFTAPLAQYTNNCIRIKAGKDVGFYGPFASHPLSGNGEPGNPIPSVTTGTDSGRIVFPTPGTYGFHCTLHASIMWGTVKVVP